MRLANAVRELARVLMRMPYQATPKLPPMPMRLKRMMIAICRSVDPVSQK